jgi:hypothetical protein
MAVLKNPERLNGLEFEIPGFRAVGVCYLPGRARPSLYRRDEATITTMASFPNAVEARLFLDWLKLATGHGGRRRKD